jgi:hypothetical protein
MYAMQTNPGTTIGGLSLRSGGTDDVDRKRLRCSKEGLAGRYGFLAEGYAGPPTLPLPSAVPLVGNGVVTLDRSGSFDATAQRSIGGTLDPQAVPLSGSFWVDSGCSVGMKFDAGFNFSGTVVDGGREVVFVETDPGTTPIVKARRQDRVSRVSDRAAAPPARPWELPIAHPRVVPVPRLKRGSGHPGALLHLHLPCGTSTNDREVHRARPARLHRLPGRCRCPQVHGQHLAFAIHLDGARMVPCQPAAPLRQSPPPSPSTK